MKNYLVESMTSYMGKLEEARNPENDKINQPIKNESLTLKEDWSKGISFLYKVNTNSLIDADKNNKLRIGGGHPSIEKLVAENDASVKFRVYNSMMFGSSSYVNLSYGQSEIVVFWKDEDFRYKDIGGKGNFRKAKLTSEMNRFLEMGREELENCGVVVNQYKVEVGGSDKFNSTWRQAQPYNESLALKEDINTPFIKIYKASPDIKAALNTIYNSDDVSDDWDFPIEELDYLLEEHPGESFVLKDDRLYEFYPEEMNESLSLKEGVDWNSFDELCEWCKNISGDVGWNTWNYAYMFLNYLYPYLNSNQINQAKADIESDVNNDDINESLSLKEAMFGYSRMGEIIDFLDDIGYSDEDEACAAFLSVLLNYVTEDQVNQAKEDITDYVEG